MLSHLSKCQHRPVQQLRPSCAEEGGGVVARSLGPAHSWCVHTTTSPPPSDTFFPCVPTAIIANLYPTCLHICDSGARASLARMAFMTQSRAAQHLHPQNSPTKLVPVPAPVSSVLTGTGFCLRACRPAGAVTSPAILSAICVGMTRGYSCPEQRGRHRYLSPRLGGGQRLTMSRILQAQLSQL